MLVENLLHGFASLEHQVQSRGAGWQPQAAPSAASVAVEAVPRCPRGWSAKIGRRKRQVSPWAAWAMHDCTEKAHLPQPQLALPVCLARAAEAPHETAHAAAT